MELKRSGDNGGIDHTSPSHVDRGGDVGRGQRSRGARSRCRLRDGWGPDDALQRWEVRTVGDMIARTTDVHEQEVRTVSHLDGMSFVRERVQ